MLRSSTSDWRAQTEPLAALFAVSVMAIAIGVYAGFVTDTLPGTSDRDVTTGTLDRVWDEINVAGVYVRDSDELSSLDPSALPEGYHVYLNITTANEDTSGSQAEEKYDIVTEEGYEPTGATTDDIVDGMEQHGSPEESQYGSRPIPVKYGPGDVRGGRLHVVAWQE
ncbi:hypothetical protein [Halosimplex sp. TS25]|uniref:DUF7285 family protein n=1 Tax=Halosimplex rarum TaxID=3396619 RepID=UPI0039E943A5